MDKEKKFNETKYKNEFNKNNYDNLRVVTPKGNKDIIQEYCKNNSMSINGLINQLLKDYFHDKGIELK